MMLNPVLLPLDFVRYTFLFSFQGLRWFWVRLGKLVPKCGLFARVMYPQP